MKIKGDQGDKRLNEGHEKFASLQNCGNIIEWMYRMQ